MSRSIYVLVFFVYGLAFFSMGLIVTLEVGRASGARLRQGLRPLAGFGLLHGIHEWIEMFARLNVLPGQEVAGLLWEALRLMLLATSFLSLAEFGASLLSPTDTLRRLSMLVPLALAALWSLGLLLFRGHYSVSGALWDVADVWTRYVLALPSALLASAGLVAQRRAFRRAGLFRFGQDALWAAIAFAGYGIVGQTFTRASALPPSTFFNQDLFLRLFGFPVQILRAASATLASTFVVRSLRAFEYETRRKIADLQAARLNEARRREARRGELLRRVVAAQEAERQRIARELHDATGQALTGLGLGLRSVVPALGQDMSAAEKRLGELERLAAGTLDELRHLIADLRPPHLDDLGLAAALRWYAKDMESRAPLEVQVEINGEPRQLSPAVNIALFRVAQEAVTNVIKHSGARHVWIRGYYREGEFKLTVDDDGRGFDASVLTVPARPTWGLLGMQERANLLGGHFEVRSTPNQGACVEVVIPYQPAEAGQ